MYTCIHARREFAEIIRAASCKARKYRRYTTERHELVCVRGYHDALNKFRKIFLPSR